MPKGKVKRLRPMAPYFVQMRELERRLILEAIALFPDEPERKAHASAAGVLGIPLAYLRVRARIIGGIITGDPKHEPPIMSASDAWNHEASNERKAKPNAS